jgi:energy-coupling factor transporter ATP-binding protein EcfA2
MSSLNPVMKCGQQVMEALVQHKNISSAEAKKKTIEWLEKVKLPEPEKTFYRYPHQLSGGQKQRVMIAIAMCCEPALLICDEPTTALDVTVQKSILQLIKELVQEKNTGVLFITHDLGVVFQFADMAAIMYKGEIIEILLPLICCNFLVVSFRRFMVSPSSVKRIFPSLYCAGGVGNNCKIESAVTDLPEPDSPTRATISPLLIVKEIFFTASVFSPSVINWMARFSICNRDGIRGRVSLILR